MTTPPTKTNLNFPHNTMLFPSIHKQKNIENQIYFLDVQGIKYVVLKNGRISWFRKGNDINVKPF